MLFELVDLWCLTHIPEDYISILKALYCRMTTRTKDPNTEGMRTVWIKQEEIGEAQGCKVKSILGSAHEVEEEEERRAGGG